MYGIDIEHVGELIQMAPAEPGHSPLIACAEYSLEKLVLHTADEYEISTSSAEAATLFIEEGAVEAGGAVAGFHKLVSIAPGCRLRLRGRLSHHRLYFPWPGRGRHPSGHLRGHL